MLDFFASTPRYAGQGQPAASSGGLLGSLGALFGGWLFPRTPQYKTPPVEEPAPEPPPPPPAGDESETEAGDGSVDTTMTEPRTSGARPVTIVIRRGDIES